jgi:hypothetical protein
MPSKVQTSVQSHHRKLWICLTILAVIPGLYLLLAYVVLPALWRHYEHNSKLEHSPKTTQTAEGIVPNHIAKYSQTSVRSDLSNSTFSMNTLE